MGSMKRLYLAATESPTLDDAVDEAVQAVAHPPQDEAAAIELRDYVDKVRKEHRDD